jgi:hypothetical protein
MATDSSDTILNQPAADGKTAKPRKAKATRAAGKGSRKTGPVSSARAAAPREATPAEVLFDQLPNPYHPPAPPYIWIDYPQQDERLLGPIYNIRMGIGGAEQVDISVDGGSWQACEIRSGYWWYDWSGIQPGKHTLVARMRPADGRWFRTPVRNCEYRP